MGDENYPLVFLSCNRGLFFIILSLAGVIAQLVERLVRNQ